MRKILPVGAIIVLIIIGFIYYQNNHVQSINRLNKEVSQISLTISPTPQVKKNTTLIKSIFVPYWQIDDNLSSTNYNKYIYFGITADNEGINKYEDGYKNLASFVRATGGKENTYLALRLLDNSFNRQLLEDPGLQEKIIGETLNVAKENNFKGVVLDLELFSLFDTGIKDQINVFVKSFYTAAKTNYKSFTIAIYGDVFFRKRPFDLVSISTNCDEILIMSYDFHKTIGEPGPNFPYNTGPDDNYSFKKMIDDFIQMVPKEKITLIYGMYGYDWQVDEKMRPISQAKALTLNQIKEKFLAGAESATKCAIENCAIKKDEESKETEIDYTISSSTPDSMGVYRIDYHVVWYEDEESAKVKTNYLIDRGINSVGYWVWGYF